HVPELLALASRRPAAGVLAGTEIPRQEDGAGATTGDRVAAGGSRLREAVAASGEGARGVAPGAEAHPREPRLARRPHLGEGVTRTLRAEPEHAGGPVGGDREGDPRPDGGTRPLSGEDQRLAGQAGLRGGSVRRDY